MKPLCSFFVVVGGIAGAIAAMPSPVDINWLGGMPAPTAIGVSWGVPWPKGAVPKGQAFTLASADGKSLPLQTWPLAYWPDGSLKWSGFATVAGPGTTGPFQLVTGTAVAPEGPKLTVQQGNGAIDIDTGAMKARLLTSGANLIE